MEIMINGQAADVTLDNEKTVGEIMAGMAEWLAKSEYRLSGLVIDGQAVNAAQLEETFSRDINTVKTLDILTSSLAQLTMESLVSLLADINEYENLKFEEKAGFLNVWKEKVQAKFTAEQMPDLYNIFINTFSGGEINSRVAFSVTEERLREVKEPMQEFANLKPLLDETCTLLTDLPLDIQTGKDARAAKTIQVFSGVAEKILRILKQLDLQGYLSKNKNDEKLFINMLNEFGKLVKDFLEAYERHDTVLVGDLAEYEAAPRLKELYTTIALQDTK